MPLTRLDTADLLRGHLRECLLGGTHWVVLACPVNADVAGGLGDLALSVGNPVHAGRVEVAASLKAPRLTLSVVTFPRAALSCEQVAGYLRRFAVGQEIPPTSPTGTQVVALCCCDREVREALCFAHSAAGGSLETADERTARIGRN